MPALVAAVLLLAAPAPPDPAAPPADSAAARAASADSSRVVRTLAPVEVRALLPDMLSSQTVHAIDGRLLRDLPLRDVADVLALQAGVVAQAGEVHVRGGRSGETTVSLEGVTFNDPVSGRALAVPLMALRRAELVSGAPDASFESGLAGTLDLETIDPPARPGAEVRWQSDGRLGTRYDRVAVQAGGPLRNTGLGIATAADVRLDDTALPTLRSFGRHDVLGMSFGWRAENRLLGYAKIAPVRAPQRFSLEVFGGRDVDLPYSPSWSLDGWTLVPAEQKAARVFSPVELPDYQRYRAADHMGITDTRHVAALLTSRFDRGPARASATLGWLRTQEVHSVDGRRESPLGTHRPSFGPVDGGDGFYVVWGDDPIYREAEADEWTMRVDGQLARDHGWIRSGGGLTYEHVETREYEWFPIGWLDGEGAPLDSTRTFDAHAPGAFAYVQGRWVQEGMVLNAGLRADGWTAGAAGGTQTLPGDGDFIWSLSPRLGLAYPISVKDVFSLAYARVPQAPAREFLYDDRRIISNRRPLGNPALRPATLVSYEASLRHLISAAWALQASLFYRDLFGLVGARWQAIPGGLGALTFTDADEAHTTGFEVSLLRAGGEGSRFELHYTWMQAWGNESRPDGETFGPLRGATVPPIVDAPLSWDRRHTLSASAIWRPGPRWALAWITRVGSPFPWTPTAFREAAEPAQRNTARLDWTEATDLSAQWTPPYAPWISLGIEVRNAFDHRGAHSASLDGFPSPVVNTVYDDYSAYRTETGNGGGAYWSYTGTPHWEAVNDPRLVDEPRTVRASVAMRW